MRRSALALMGVAALAVAGCGSGSHQASPSTASSSQSAAVTSSAAPTPSTSGAQAPGAAFTLRVASNTNTGALPVWVAIDEGIFAKHGLDVQFTQVNNVGTLPPQLGKTFDIALVTPAGAIAATAQGIPVTEVAGAYTDTVAKPDSFLMVKKGSDITSLAQLKGKTIGALTVAGTLNYATLKMLDEAGVPPSAVKVITVNGPEQQAQLDSGRVDAVETLVPFSAQIKAAGGTSLGIPFQSIAPSVSVIWWGANPTWAGQHEQQIMAFRAALADAIAFIEAQPTKAQAIGAKYTKLPTSLVAESTKLDYDPSVRAGDIAKWIAVMQKYGGFKGTVDPAKMVFQP